MGDNLQKTEPYTSGLQSLGIEVLYGKWFSGTFQNWFIENANDINYVYLHRPHIAENHIDIIRKTGKSKILYFGHDLHFLRIQRQAEIENNPELFKEVNNWRKRECSLFEKSDVIYFPSYVETEKVKELFPDKIVRTIPLYVLDPVEVMDNCYDEKKDIFFVGGFRHVPNVDGVLWFVKEVFPVLQKQLPGVKFHVAGSMMPPEILSLASEDIVIHGEVSDTRLNELYEAYRVIVVPLRFGAGIKGKVVEALFKQVPVVTTDVGAEGLRNAESYLRIGNSAEQFAKSVIEIYNNGDAWAEQVNKGVEAVNRDFSRESAFEVLSKDFDLTLRN
jgi:glycosyltransferase involved in cell wall biosynthesis